MVDGTGHIRHVAWPAFPCPLPAATGLQGRCHDIPQCRWRNQRHRRPRVRAWRHSGVRSKIRGTDFPQGGATGFREALRALKNGQSVGLTADIPKGPARIAGPGIVTLAQVSGRPFVPMGMATSRRRTMDSWDKASLNLPFGRMVLAYGEPIHIPRKISGPEMAEWRQVVAEGLNEVTERAPRDCRWHRGINGSRNRSAKNITDAGQKLRKHLNGRMARRQSPHPARAGVVRSGI